MSSPTAQSQQSQCTKLLLLSVFSSTMGGSFLYGYNIGNMNTPEEVMKNWFIASHRHLFNVELSYDTISKVQWAIAIGLFAVGGMIGGLASGWVADRFGRKGGMFLNNLFAIIAAVLLTIAKYVNVYHLIWVGRIFIGINAGMTSGLVPMYLTEISPVHLRGALGSVNQLIATVAILFAQILGLPQILGTKNLWPIIFAIILAFVILQFCTLPFCPESPKYSLVVKNRPHEAERALRKLRGCEDVSAEMETIREEATAMAAVEKVSMGALFRSPLLWPMFIAIMMMLAQQLSGINVAMFYSTIIFKSAGMGSNAVYATLGMGVLNVLMTIVSVYLVDHPRFGRRLLLLLGLCGMFIASILLVISISVYNKDKVAHAGLAWFSMICVFFFVMSFAIGPGSIPWFYVSELFDSSARGNANSIAVMVNWTANFVVSTSFEFLMDILVQFSFLIFTGFLLFFIFFVFVYCPETKDRSPEDIMAEFKLGKSIFTRPKSSKSPPKQ